MVKRRRATQPTNAARIAVAGVIMASSALALAGQAAADPAVPPPTPAPGQPVVEALEGPAGLPPVPPPVLTPTVPEIANPVYGGGQGQGAGGFIRDMLSGDFAQDLYAPPGPAAGPPPGAGPAPKLPPGFTSLTAPESSTPSDAGTLPEGEGPPLPAGYYPLDGPPPPGSEPLTGPNPAPPPMVVPFPPMP